LLVPEMVVDRPDITLRKIRVKFITETSLRWNFIHFRSPVVAKMAGRKPHDTREPRCSMF